MIPAGLTNHEELVAATLAAALIAACGFGLRRSAPPIARCCGFAVAIGFAVAAMMAPRPVSVSVVPRSANVSQADEPSSLAPALLAAAARSGPRGVEVAVSWSPSMAGALRAHARPSAALGAAVAAPPALPLDVEAVRLRCVGEAAVARPMLLELSCAQFAGPVPIDLTVRVEVAGRAVLQQALALGATASELTLVPDAPGPHSVEVVGDVSGHRLVWRGEFDVAPADELLVVERGELLAAALRAQGVRVRSAPALPEPDEQFDAWLGRARVVLLAEPVPAAVQQALVSALADGLGLFVLGPAFGADGAPLRSVLPVRVLPLAAVDGDRAGGSGSEARHTESVGAPPRDVPPRSEPRLPEPIGETGDHQPVSGEPIEVDKHTIALVLVVDRSGSMGTLLANGLSKMSYAKTSAWRTATSLMAGDEVGVVTFGNRDAGRVELPMTDAADLGAVRAGIDKLGHAPEFTYLLSGLRLARRLLERHPAAVKHVVIVSDGEFVLDEGIALSAEARRMLGEDHITVSMVSIVDAGTDRTFLHEAGELTKAGGGAFRTLTDPSQVPAMVSAEVTRALSKVGRKPRTDGVDPTSPEAAQPSAGEPEAKPPEPSLPEPPPPSPSPEAPVEADPLLPVHAVTTSPLLAPDPVEWPPVRSVWRSEAPLDARVLLVAGDAGWPLLAYANRGLGRIGMLAIDLARDAQPLREAGSFPAWLAQWVRAVAPLSREAASREVSLAASVVPSVPTADERAMLAAIAGAAVVERLQAPAPVVGATAVEQAADHAAWLLLALLALAGIERLAGSWSIRRGRPQQ